MRQKNNNTLTKIFSSTSLPSDVLKVILSVSLIVTASVSCTPSTTNNYLTANGSDKKLPDDDGYTGSGGTGDGGGGQGILCSDATKNPQFKSKLMVRDIFEASFIQKLKLRPGPTKKGGVQDLSDEELQFLHSNLKRYFGHAIGQLEVGSYKFWQKFVSNISFIDEEAKLFPSKDANSPIALPAGCKIVQIAFWEDSPGNSQNGTLYVDKKLWSQLDSINRLALLVHEYFFKEARQAGFKNSDFVRAKVGQFFSDFTIKPLFKDWKPTSIAGISTEALASDTEVYKFCRGTVHDDPSAELHLYYYDYDKITIPLLRSKNVSISSLQGFDFQTPAHGEYPWVNHFTSAFNIIHLRSFATPYNLEMLYTGLSSAELNPSASLLMGELGRHVWGSGFGHTDGSIESWTSTNAEVTTALAPVMWSAQGFTPNAALHFELENPVSAIVPKSVANLPDITSQIFDLFAHEIQQFIKELRYAEKSGPLKKNGAELKFENLALSEDEIQAATIALYSALSSDIENLLKDGNFKGDLQNWNNTFEKFISTLFHVQPKERTKQLKSTLEYKFRNLIYKNKLGILTATEKSDLATQFKEVETKKSSDDNGLPFQLKKGKLTVKNSTNQVEFELSCEGAGEPYNRSLINTKSHSIQKMNLKVDYKIDSVHNPIRMKLTKERLKQYIDRIVDLSLSQKSNVTFMGDRLTLKEHLESSSGTVIKSCESIDNKFYSEQTASDPYETPADGVFDESDYCLVIDFPKNHARYLLIASDVDGISNPHEMSTTPFMFIRGLAPTNPETDLSK